MLYHTGGERAIIYKTEVPGENHWPEKFNNKLYYIKFNQAGIRLIYFTRDRVRVFNATYNNISDRVRVMVFNATFNNISVLLWRSVLLVEGSDRHKLHNLMEINLLCIHFYSLKLIFHQPTKNWSQWKQVKPWHHKITATMVLNFNNDLYVFNVTFENLFAWNKWPFILYNFRHRRAPFLYMFSVKNA